MEILFGKHLDGSRGVILQDSLGQAILGPQGFLALLETHLGLLGVLPSQSERIIQYAAILARGKAGAFYEKSFDLDELGTARTLLGWRDEWYLHGWTGGFRKDHTPRLTQLADIEHRGGERVGLCEGQRLQRIAQALKDGFQVPVDRLELLEDLSQHPLAWQKVLEFFSPTLRPMSGYGEDSLLADIQNRLTGNRPDAGPISWRDDGSIRVVQSDSPLLAARWLAIELHKPPSARLLLADARASLLDEVLQTHGLPLLGLDERSVSRPALQVLPLALQQLWRPVNVHALLEFLTHPVCPVPAFARRIIAARVADRPGIDQSVWLRLIAEHAPQDNPQLKTIAEQAVQFYLTGLRYHAAQGVPVERVLLLAKELAQFFQRRLALDDAHGLAASLAGYQQCAAFAKAVEALHDQQVAFLSPRQLQILQEQATTSGAEHGLGVVQAGAVPCATHPAGAGGDFEQVIWWQPVMPDLPGNYPWSLQELDTLRDSGVRLPPLTKKLEWIAVDWLRPVLAAKRNLTLVLPPHRDEAHPVWLMIKALCPDLPVQSLEDRVFQGRSPETSPIVVKPLPPVLDRWKLPAGTIPTLRDVDSYSSLNIQLNNPSQWVLTYVARLRESSQLAIPDIFTLKGTLAHHIIESLFLAHGVNALAWGESELTAWFDPAYAALIEQEGAVFLMPGKHNEGALFRAQLLSAIRSLLRMLKAADVQSIQPECDLEGTFEGGSLRGSADLVLTLPLNQPVILDMKWSGKLYAERLQQNRQLQLAIYGELYRQMGHAFAKPAYYVLSSMRMFHVDEGLFPGEKALKKDEALGGGAELWQSFLKTWRWRQQQLKKGEVHVVTEATAGLMEPAPEDGFSLDNPSDRYNPYVALCGWRQDQ